MGVPKFYRWISERYPCLSQVVKDYQIPEFDNFYLDMNGIIHVCSHPNDDDPTFRISEEKIFGDIFRYVETLFRIIKPQKVLFLAVDGVAPRAKMNQQRGRRFRSAREAQDLIRKALQKGQVLPSEPHFDSNCITPGTEFMAKLQQHLKYFVHKKLSTDPTWQQVEVILSGQDVPGEGEHKIMDYIRHQKAQPGYDSNTRHCLYGLDADLIMLGLSSHEPHFSLLREEVRFGKKSQKRQTNPDSTPFHLLHLSIMREYLDFEFSTLKSKLPFAYDLEHIIDDWILMGFLVGNDFIPNLPNMHIRQEALPLLYQKYIEVLPTLDGYINVGGSLHMGRFEVYLQAVAEFDRDYYSELIGGMKWLENKKTPQNKKKGRKKKEQDRTEEQEAAAIFPGLAEWSAPQGAEKEQEEAGPLLAGLLGNGEEQEEFDEDSEAAQKLKRDLGISSLQSYFQEEDVEKLDSFDHDFWELKTRYYQEKMGFARVDDEVLAEQTKCYVVGVQWVLHYYYSGVPSWSWFYPYHYAPFCSDIQGFSDLSIEFELGIPFLPFEQLLAVLPPASKSLLPKAFQGLMINEDSPIKDYYPIDFETDLNGKQQEWEAVVLIPFINEERLLDAMKPCSIYLSDEEVSRNTQGCCLVCDCSPDAESTVYPSPWPQAFPDLTNCKTKCTELPSPPFQTPSDRLVQGLCQGVKLDVYFPGFPTLKHVDHDARLEKRGVRVFQAASRGENVILTLLPRQDLSKDTYTLARQLVGQVCFVGWPYLAEAKVSAISDRKTRYYHDPAHKSRVKVVERVLSEGDVKQWKEEETAVARRYVERMGIEIGAVNVLIYAQVLQGRHYILDKHGPKGAMVMQKQWSPNMDPFPHQITVVDIAAHAPEFREKAITLEQLFPPKSECFIVSPPHYGSLAEVISVDMSQLRLHVKVRVRPEPEMDSVMGDRRLSVRYIPSYAVASQVHLPSLALARITSSVQCERGSRENTKEREKLNIGLGLKFNKRNQELLGYARKTDAGWSFSTTAVALVREFMERYPRMFQYIGANPGEDKYYESDLFPDPDSSESLTVVKEWLKKLPTHGMDTVDCGGQSLDEPQIVAIEKATLDVQRQMPKYLRTVKLRVKPSVLFKPMHYQGNLIPDLQADYQLFDRVVNVSASNAVPFGLRGTITGILGEDGPDNTTMYEIVFDEEFLGGLTLRCSPNKAYRLPASCILNISYGKRLETQKDTKQGRHTHPGTSYSAVVQSPHGHPGHAHRHQGNSPRDQHHGPHGAWGTRSMEYVTESSRAQRLSPRGGSPYQHGNKSPQSSRKQGQGERGSGRGESPRTVLQRPDRGAKETAAKPIPKASGAATEFSSMMKEMESHSKKMQLSSSPKHTVLRYSQQSVSSKQRGESDGATASQGKGETKKDTFSAAMEALPKVRMDSKAAEGDQTKNIGVDNKVVAAKASKELSPSVAAVFSSVSASNTGAGDKDNVPKGMRQQATAGKSPSEPSPHGRMPEAIQKLMHPPPPPHHGHAPIRGPLLPHPPPMHHYPHPPMRGPGPPGGFPRYPPPPPPHGMPPAPFGPPPMDPLTLLYHSAHTAGLAYPKVTSKEIEPGLFVGQVEVGKMKFRGAPCPSPEDAKQSAAAVANSNWQGPFPGYPMMYYPMPYYNPPGPYMGPPGPPHYPGPPHPFHMGGPGPGPGPGPYHPRGPRPPPGPPTPAFVPLQVQRRQAQKSPQPRQQQQQEEEKKASKAAKGKDVQTGSQPTTASRSDTTEDPPISDEEKLELETAKRNLLDSLTKAAQEEGEKPPVDAAHTDTEDEQDTAESGTSTSELVEDPKNGSPESVEAVTEPREDGGVDPEEKGAVEAGEEKEGEDASALTQPNLIGRLEAALESNVETHGKLKKLSEMMTELGEAREGMHMPSASVSQLDGSSFQIEDEFAQAALLGAFTTVRDGDGETQEVYQEAVQPSDTATEGSIHVVGEIVASLVTNPENAASTPNDLAGVDSDSKDGVPAPSTTEQSLTTTNAVVDASKAEEIMATGGGEKLAARKPKRQLAASFMHNS